MLHSISMDLMNFPSEFGSNTTDSSVVFPGFTGRLSQEAFVQPQEVRTSRIINGESPRLVILNTACFFSPYFTIPKSTESRSVFITVGCADADSVFVSVKIYQNNIPIIIIPPANADHTVFFIIHTLKTVFACTLNL